MNQQEWTAVIRALEKIGAAGTGHNVKVTGAPRHEQEQGK